MTMIDQAGSTITLRTEAKGMLSRLAHDLEIDASSFESSVDVEGESWSAALTFPVAALRVTGAVKNGRVDTSVLSASDKSEIEKRIRTELPGREIQVRLEGQSRDRADVTVTAPRGEQKLSARLGNKQQDGDTVVFGDLRLSLKRLGVKEIKGPLNAFRVDDTVAVAFVIKLAE